MKIEVNIEKKYVLAVIISILVLAGGITTYALTAGTAPNPGHLINEVAPPAGCADGQVLSYNNSSWSCVNLPATIDCVKVTSFRAASDTAGWYATCDAGYTAVAGGCYNTNSKSLVYSIRGDAIAGGSPQKWTCGWVSTSPSGIIYAYAYCCK